MVPRTINKITIKVVIVSMEVINLMISSHMGSLATGRHMADMTKDMEIPATEVVEGAGDAVVDAVEEVVVEDLIIEVFLCFCKNNSNSYLKRCTTPGE